jgi:hypothetical protein
MTSGEGRLATEAQYRDRRDEGETTTGIDLGKARAIWQETSDYSTVG